MRISQALFVLLAVPILAPQSHQPAGFTGRIPWCASVFPPQKIRGEMVYPVANGVSGPELLKQITPVVPADKASIKGTAIVCGIVSRNGRIHTTFMDRTLGNGLDEIAEKTVRQWKYRPAMKDGKPVAAPTRIELKFGD